MTCFFEIGFPLSEQKKPKKTIFYIKIQTQLRVPTNTTTKTESNHKNKQVIFMDPSTQIEDEINIKKEFLKEKLEIKKSERDSRYQQAREYAEKRNTYNEKVSKYLARIQDLRELRNDLTTKLQQYKDEKAKITAALEISQDEELEKEVEALQKKIRTCATESQNYHKKIMELNKEMNEIRSEANALQEKYLENKVKGEGLHQEHTALTSELYGLTKISNEMSRQKGFAELPHATELENQAIMERKDYERKAELFKEAAKIRDKEADTKGAMNDWANYFLIKANILSRKNRFMVAKKYFDCAEQLFLDTDQERSAFYTTLQKVRSINIKLKKLLYHKKEHERELEENALGELAPLLEEDFGGEREYINDEPVIPREDLSLQESFDLYFSELQRFFDVYKEFSNEKQYTLRQISYYNKKAIFYQRKKDLEAELTCYGDSIDFLESLDINTLEKNWFKSTIKKQKACYYFIKGKVESDFRKSAEYYKNASKLWASLGNEKSELYNLAYHNYALGRLHELDNLQKARIHYGKAIEIWDRLNNTLSKKYTYAYYYHVIARISEHENDLIKAKNYYIKASELWKELGNEKSEKYNYAYLNHVYAKERSDSEESISYYKKAMELWQELGNINSEKFNRAHYYHAKAKFATTAEEKMENYKKAAEVWEDMGNEKSKHYNLAYYYETLAKVSNKPEEQSENWKNAKEFWEKVGEQRNAQYCEANYLSGSGMYYIYTNELEKGREMLQKAEKTFTTLGIKDSSLFSRYHYVKSYEFEMKENQAWDIELYIQKLEDFLEDFEGKKDNPRYVDRKISYYKNMALAARKNKDLNAAMEYTEKCYQYCQEYYKETNNETLKQDYFYHKSVYHKIMAKRLISQDDDPTNIKVQLQKSCEYMGKVDKLQSYIEWSYYYKYLAWLAVPDEESFDSYLKKAVKFAKNAQNKKLEISLEGFELEASAFRERDMEKKVALYEQALEKYKKISDYEKIQCITEMIHYFRAKDFLFGDDIKMACQEMRNLEAESNCAVEKIYREKDYDIVDFIESTHLFSVYKKIDLLKKTDGILTSSEGKSSKTLLKKLKKLEADFEELRSAGLLTDGQKETIERHIANVEKDDDALLELRKWFASHIKEEFESRSDIMKTEKDVMPLLEKNELVSIPDDEPSTETAETTASKSKEKETAVSEERQGETKANEARNVKAKNAKPKKKKTKKSG